MKNKTITLKNGKQPTFAGEWKVGEVLQMAQQLAVWVESLQVPALSLEKRVDEE